MQVWDEGFKSTETSADPNNIFHYFSPGSANSGYGAFLSQDLSGKIILKDSAAISSILYSIILYPEVLAEGEDRNYFLEVRKKLREEIEENRNVNVSILNILEKTEGYKKIFEKIKKNFDEPKIFEEYLKNIDGYLDENNKRGIFNEVLLNLKLNKETNQLMEIKNPHLTGDASKIPEKIDFEEYLSVEELKKKPENEQIRIMNKMLKGKFLPENLKIDDKMSKQEAIIQYMSSDHYNKKKEDIPFILNIIKQTDSFKKGPVVKTFVNKYLGQKVHQKEETVLSMG